MGEWVAVGGSLITVVAAAVVALTIWYSRNRNVNYQADGLIVEMSRRLDELTLQVVELKLALSYSQVENATLRAQVLELGGVPAMSQAKSIQQTMEEEPLVRIYQLITEHFGISEMDELAAKAGVPPESYSGEARPARALSLVQYAARHGRLEELVVACRRMRPRVMWPMVYVK